MKNSLEKQVDGDNYKILGIQPWEIIDENNLNFYERNAIKYILRKKGDRAQDLKKAIHYLEHLIEIEIKGLADEFLGLGKDKIPTYQAKSFQVQTVKLNDKKNVKS